MQSRAGDRRHEWLYQQPDPKLRRRIVPISSQIIATEELPEDVARELIPNGRTISESPRVTSYYRLLPGDRRVMYGGRARFENVHPDVSAALLYQMMTDRWPQLKGVRITHSWSGFVAMTVDALPHMGKEDGLHYCTGCNGSGVAMMTYLGRQVARRILQDSQSVSAYEFRTAEGSCPVLHGKPLVLADHWKLLSLSRQPRAPPRRSIEAEVPEASIVLTSDDKVIVEYDP